MKENKEWLMRVIASCENAWQLKTAFKMYELFKARYYKKDDDEVLDAIFERQTQLTPQN